jgi:hypothetical protein
VFAFAIEDGEIRMSPNAKLDAIANILTDEMDVRRKRRNTFEAAGADDAARSADCDLDLIKSLADRILAVMAVRS